MSRFIVQYNPPISNASQSYIAENVTASMISQDESSSQFCIDMSIEALQESGNFEADLLTIKSLAEEGVHFLEF